VSSERPLYLIRHAKAGSRYRWQGPDERRPLTKSGRRQAQALVQQLRGRPIRRLLASPALRCVETLEPLAAALGRPIERSDALVEGSAAEDVIALVEEIAREGAAACCTHGDVLELALDWLRGSGVPLDGPAIAKKGSAWILACRTGNVVSGRYLPPPG
jgi:broad specificity phosphatase PhoE